MSMKNIAIIIENENFACYKHVWTVKVQCPICKKVVVVDFFASFNEAVECRESIRYGEKPIDCGCVSKNIPISDGCLS